MFLLLITFHSVLGDYHIIEEAVQTSSHAVTRDQWNLIEVFENAGIVISSQYNNHLCKLQHQELRTLKLRDINIIPKFQEKLFRAYFTQGSFHGQLPEFIAITAVSQGLLILTNDHTLLFVLQHKSSFAVQSSIVLDQELLKPVHMVVFQDKLMILSPNMSIFIDLNFKEDNVNPFGKPFVKFEYNLSKDIIKIISDKFIYIITANSLSSYEIQDNKMTIIDSIRISQIDDFVIDSDTIYVLQQRQIQQYTLDLVQKNTSNQVIGDMIAVNNRTLIVAQVQDQQTLITDMQITENTLSVNRVFKIPRKISSITIMDYFAILKTENGHQIYYHSIPQYFKETPLIYELKTVNSKYTYIQKLDKDYLIYGVTSHSFVSYYVQYQQPQLKCYINDTDYTLSLDLYTSQCNSKIDTTDNQSICHQKLNCDIYVLEAYLTNQHKIYLIIVLITITLIISSILLILFIRYRQVKNYRPLSVEVQLDHDETDNQGIIGKSRSVSIISTPNHQMKPNNTNPIK